MPDPPGSAGRILIGHGGGGRLGGELIREVFAAAFSNPVLDRRHDAAVLPASKGRLAFTTDAHVVRPLFFPGGDIGSLAVHGTVNDLAMSGARPIALAAAFILEEGLPLEDLGRVVDSMASAARACGIPVVTGDTKVVEAGKADGLYVTTTGVGVMEHALDIEPASVREGDAILISGDIGCHGMAIMAVREGLAFESAIESDSAPVTAAVLALIEEGIDVHCLRDLTRGGLAAALVEIAEAAGLEFRLEEARVPVRQDVQTACDLLGLDPWQVACEGRFVAFVPPAQAQAALGRLRHHATGAPPMQIGTVARGAGSSPRVVVLGALGGERVVRMPAGEQLPRIC